MKKTTHAGVRLSLLCLSLLASPVAAESVQDQQQDIQSDKSAIHKDNRAIGQDADKLSQDRAAKAAAKANNNYGTQAAKSVAIAADKTAIEEKQSEKKVDQKILAHNKKKLNEDTQSQNSSGQ